MDILVITPFYTPDLGPSAPLFQMLSTELVKLGHRVSVIAAVPHYPTGRVQPAFHQKKITSSLENGVNVIRIPVPSLDRSNLTKRYFQFICYQIGAAIAITRQKFDVTVVSNPALWVWMPFIVASVFRKKPAIFSIHDLYPNVGISLGVFKRKAVISAVSGLEKFVLKRSDVVRILSESFRPTMNALGVPDEKIVLIYDWVDTDLIRPLSQRNGFANENHLENKFVVMYAGNVGLSQGLEHVLTAAKLLKDQEEIQFAIIGEGTARKELIRQADEEGIKNVTFIPFQPRERLPEVLSTADISLVILRAGVGATALPSKTYSIFASGRPILACVDDGCETADLIHNSGAGICIKPETPEELVKTILFLKNNPELREEMGRNGRKWAEAHHSPSSAAKKIADLSCRVIETHSGKGGNT
ncbi:MAG: glycosyltransferase family 4 protein [Chloroflexi bacterium]|nr:glycosyltransferase family 4 protein [Chloroflexota bacterium]